MKTLKQRIDELRAELEAVEKQIKEQKPVDGFRICDEDNNWMMYVKDGVYKFGINSHNIWVDVIDPFPYDETTRLATPEEVTKRLTEFVNGLGYVKGTKVKPLYVDGCSILGDNKISFIKGKDEYFILYGGLDIWSSLKGWAKIIEEPKFTVELGRRDFGVNNLGGWSDIKGAIFNFTIMSKSMSREEYNDINRYTLAKEIETFLNSKSETFTTK